MDATGEIFLRSEGRTGGPLDPYTGFVEAVELLFSKAPQEHPMNELLSKFQYSVTPKCANSIKEEEAAPDTEDVKPSKEDLRSAVGIVSTFSDITQDIQLLSESKRNSLNAD